jgi:hypothetical protein
MDPMENLCTICGAMFSSVLGQIKHEKASHSLIELKCKECKYVALGKKNLNNHIQIHKESCCDFCWKFIEEACKERGIKNPKLIPFMDGSVDNCIVAAVLIDKDDDEEELIEKYKATGSKRVLLLAKVAGVPETRENYEIIIKALNLASLPNTIQIVCDLKLISLLLGIQTASAMHGCPFCDSFKVNDKDKKVNTRGRYREVDENNIVMRTWQNIEDNNDNYLLEGQGNRNILQNFKNCEFKPIKLKNIKDMNEEVIFTLPPEPLHTNILGPELKILPQMMLLCQLTRAIVHSLL